MRPEDFWQIDPAFADLYREKTQRGKEIAADSELVVLGCARDCQKNLTNSLHLINELGSCFKYAAGVIYENDSVDDTKKILNRDRPGWLEAVCQTLDRPHLHGFEEDRTLALAQYRNRCLEWARSNHIGADYVVVVDLDADGGFSVDGVLNSLAWLEAKADAAGMASYSLYRVTEGDEQKYAQHDAWAARLNHWDDRCQAGLQQWFHLWMPPAGSEPVPFYSAFGGLATYRAAAYYVGQYRGRDCEHVPFHRSIREKTGLGMYLNPGSRFATILN